MKSFSNETWIFFPESSRPYIFWISRSSHPEGFLGKGVLKICSKFAREYPCLNVVSIKLLSNFANIIVAMSYMKWNFFIIFQKLFGITFKTSRKNIILLESGSSRNESGETVPVFLVSPIDPYFLCIYDIFFVERATKLI